MAIRKTGSADDQQLETETREGLEVTASAPWSPSSEAALAEENTDADS